MKRGEISMEVIIIAAIALLILVILSVLIIRSGVLFGEGTSCSGIPNSVCSVSCDGLTDFEGNPMRRSFHSCTQDGDVCCVPLG